jgi:hypothetical protein
LKIERKMPLPGKKPKDSKEHLFNELKKILGSLPTRLTESEVIELAKAAWREAVVQDVTER